MHKRLVICCDGTWNRADQAVDGKPCPTNVVKLAYRIAKADHDMPQIVHYDQGVGTGISDRFMGGGFGRGLDDNVYEAYRFLIGNFEPGDEIFIFGFSRGAYTARSLAGMIFKCGILRRASIGAYREALALYRNFAVRPNHQQAIAFRTANSCCGAADIPIAFLGVWDTVGALGIPGVISPGDTSRPTKYSFHDTELSRAVKVARQALAIDERRGPFMPSLWLEKPKDDQSVKQVWFAGVHSDVGGGYTEPQLSDLTLDWMLREAEAAGLQLDDEVMRNYPLDLSGNADIHDSMSVIYSLLEECGRPIPLGGTHAVHESVLARWDTDRSYRPLNLLNWLRTGGDRRVVRRA